MKKFSLVKLISLIFVCAMLMGAIVVTAFAADTDESVKIHKKNIYFGDTIQIMVAVDAPDGVEYEVVAEYVDGSKSINMKDFGNVTIENDGTYPAYITASGVAPQNINTVVKISVLVEGEVVDSINYSVLEYLYSRLNTAGVAADKIAMYEALLAYAKAADAVVNNEEGRTPNNLDSYYYVKLDGATLDGYNNSGVFTENSTPFANITAEIREGEKVDAWYYSVDGGDEVLATLETIQTLTVTGDMTIRAEFVANECQHTNTQPATCTEGEYCPDCDTYLSEPLGHDMAPATCQAPSTCKNGCGKTEGTKAHHVDANADGKCDTEACGIVVSVSATLTFDDTSKRTEFSNDKQVWVENGITFTNDKSSSTSNVADYSNPVRIYANSEITIEFSGMTKIEFLCNTSTYANTLKNSIGDAATVNDKVVTVILDGVNSFTATIKSSQVRVDSINVYSSSVHVWDEGTVTQEPTCTTEGVKTATCVVCGKEDTVSIPTLPHDTSVTLEAVDATCSETGLTEGKACSCGKVVVAQTVTPKLPHTEEIIPAVGATCTTDGSTEGVKCSVCGEIITAPTTVGATGHNDTDGDGFCDNDNCGADLNTDENKALAERDNITAPSLEVTEAGNIDLDITPNTYSATISWAITGGSNEGSAVTDGVLTVVLNDTETTIELTVTVTVGEATATKTYTITVAATPKANPVVVLEITLDDFNSTSYAANNNEKTEGNYSYTSNQVMKQNNTMQWQKNSGYITLQDGYEFAKLEMKVTAGTYTVTVGGEAVTGTTSNGVTTYDLTGLSGQINISVGSVTGKVDYIKFYK